MNVSSLQNTVSNNQILTIASENSLIHVEQIYDRYAPSIYRIINTLIDDSDISEKIFKDTILKIKDNFSTFFVNGTIYPNLMRFTYGFALQQLNHYGMSPKIDNSMKNDDLTYLLFTRYESLQQVTSSLKISQDEARKILRKEYLNFKLKTSLL